MHLSYYRRPLFLLLLVYAGGIFLLRGRLLRPPPLPFGLPRAGALVEGRVAEYPVSVPGGVRFQLETSSLYGRPVKTGLMVYAPAGTPASYGDRVSMLADLSEPPAASAPGSLDWADYLYRRGMAAQARALELEVIKPANCALMTARRFREAALGAFRAGLPPEAAAVFGGVVLGEKKSVPPDLKEAFRDSGAMHLLVASGSNVGFVVAVVYFLCSRLGRRPAGIAALAAAGFYVLAAGLDAPLVRAYLMFSAGLLAWMLRRESGAFQALTAAALLILLVSPRSLFDAGFQMSFLAAYGLTVGLALWGKKLPLSGFAGKALGLLLVSFFAQLCLYPLLAVYFHRISVVSLVSNMFLVPASGAAMALGFMLAVSGGFLFEALSFVSGHFMGLFIGAVRFFAALPFAAVSVPEPSALQVAGFFVLALALLHAPLPALSGRRLLLPAGLGLVLVYAGTFPGPDRGAAAHSARLFGEGETYCALVAAPGGLYLVNPGIKGGKLAAAVLSAGSRSLRGALLTSLEEKNYAGLEELAREVRIERVLLPPGPRPAGLSKLLGGLAARGAEVLSVWPGDAPPPGGGPAAAWGGYSPGYSGTGDILDWDFGAFRITREGAAAAKACGGELITIKSERGKTTLVGPVTAADRGG